MATALSDVRLIEVRNTGRLVRVDNPAGLAAVVGPFVQE